jgi:hypothetical protein
MTLYSRPQLRLLLAVAATLLMGLAVREWRAGFPEHAAYLDRFDQETDPPALPSPAPHRSAAPVRASAGRDVLPPRDAPRPQHPSSDDDAIRPAGAPAPEPLDLNRASFEEIARLPGVGRGLAERIVDERRRRGGFESRDDLRHVLGLGPKKHAALRELVTVARPGGAEVSVSRGTVSPAVPAVTEE